MFNTCILSGLVLTEPKFKIHEGFAQAMFGLGIMFGPYKAGCIKVCCPKDLAAVATSSIHRGDRVAVVGAIGHYEYEPWEKKRPLELVFVATDLELVRKDSPGQELLAMDKNPES